MIAVEIRKLFTSKAVLILLAALAFNLILVNFGVQSAYTGDSFGAPPSAYRQIFSELSGMAEEEKVCFLKTLSENAEAESVRMEIASYEQRGSLEEADMMREEYAELLSEYPDTYVLQYLPTLQQEIYFLNKLLSEAEQLAAYDEFLAEKEEEANLKTKISIFAKPDTFTYRNMQKIAEDFHEMRGTHPLFDISDGVAAATDTVVTDWIAVLLLLFVSGQLIIREKERGILPVIKASKNGRIPVIAAKITVVALGAAVLAFLFFGENLIYGECVFGLGDLSRPIQSLAGFQSCTLHLSVGQYLACLYLVKVLAYFFAGLISMAVCMVFFQPVLTYSFVAGLLAVSYVLYGIIEPISKWNIFRYVNTACLLSGTSLFQGEQNLNMFGFPVGIFHADLAVVLIGIFLLVLLNLCMFARRRNTEMPLRLPALKKKKKRITFGKSVSVLYHELFKLFVTNKALLLVVVLLVFQIETQKEYVFFKPEELFEKNYMETLSGDLTPEKEEYIEKEKERFAKIQGEMEALVLKYQNGEISGESLRVLSDGYVQKLAPQPVFENQILPLYEHLKQKQEEGQEACFVYDGGYRTLMAQEEYRTGEQDIERGTMLLLLLILCCAGLFPMEYTSGMQAILMTSRNGRKKTVYRKLAACGLLGAILFVIVYLPDILSAAKFYGLTHSDAPLNSLMMFSDWGNGWTIWQYLLVLYLLRFVTMIVLIVLISYLSTKMKQVLPAMFVNTLLLLPFVFHILGVVWLDRFSFIPLLTGNRLLQSGIGWIILYVTIEVGIGIVAAVGLVRSQTVIVKKKSRDRGRNPKRGGI